MLQVVTTNQFEKDIKTIKKRQKKIDKLMVVLEILANQKELPEKYCNHKLKGEFVGRFECHIEPDWLLIYAINENILKLERTGSHSDLFK